MLSGVHHGYGLGLVLTTMAGMFASAHADLGSSAGYLPNSISSPGTTPWTVVLGGAPGGHDAIRSGAVLNAGSTTALLTLNGPGILSFDWRVSSETNADWLLCELTDPEGDIEIAGISQPAGAWERQQVFIPQGVRVLRWVYRKNESGAAGDDAGYVANVAYNPIAATARNFLDWAAAHSHSPGTPMAYPLIRDDTAWLLEVDPKASQPAGIPQMRIGAEGPCYRLRFSNSATGLLAVQHSGDLQSWTSRGLRYVWDQTASTPAVSEFDVMLPAASRRFIRTSNQAPRFLFLGDATGTITLDSTTRQVTVRTYHPWAATSSQPWLQIAPASGLTSGLLTLQADPNTGNESRSATLTINNQRFDVIQPMDLGYHAGYLPNSIMSPEPNAWTAVSGTAPGGHDAIRSGTPPNGGSSTAQLTLNGPGIVSFDWRVSAEANADWLLCEITDSEGDHEVAGISQPDGSWEHQQLFIPQGSRILRWVYRKNESGAAGDDAGYVANVAYYAIAAAAQNFVDWAAAHGHPPGTPTAFSQIRDDTAWLMGIDPMASQPEGIPELLMDGDSPRYRVRYSNSAPGLLKVQHSRDAQNWTSRGLRYVWNQAASIASYSVFDVILSPDGVDFARTDNQPARFLVLGDSPGTIILDSNNKQIPVRTYHPWAATSTQPWLKTTPASGLASGLLTLQADPNIGNESRSTTLTINNQRFDIIQPKVPQELFYFHSEQVSVADGPDTHGRQYHAFPDLTKIGSTYWLTYMTAGGHADRRGDIVLKSSSDCRTWTERKRFAASRPSGPIVVGDYEYREGNVTDLGGGCLVCVMHKYTVSNVLDLLEATGNRTAWSLSTDNGETWSTPAELLPINAAYPSIGGRGCIVWKGWFYLPIYANSAYGGFYRTTVETLKSGSPSWNTVDGEFGQEACLLINPDNAEELWCVSRSNVSYINIFKTTDGTTWSSGKRIYWRDGGSTTGHKPLMVRTRNGHWVMPHRKPTNLMAAEVHVGAAPLVYYSYDGTVADEIWPNTVQNSVPNPLATLNERAWDGVEKSMYFGMVPLDGDLVAMAYALEPQEQYNSVNSVQGHRCSVFFSIFGSGNGETPLGSFSPATQDLMDGSVIDLTERPTAYRKWMTQNTTFTITNGPGSATLELFGDFMPSFSDGIHAITPAGTYHPDRKNVVLIAPGPLVTIQNSPPPNPMQIPGLARRVKVMLTPSGMVTSGTSVTAWINEGDVGFWPQYTASTLKPTVAAASTPNGASSVQGALTSYFNGPADSNTYAVYALAYYPAATWSNHLETITTAAIQAELAGSARLQTDPPYVSAYQHQIDGVTYDAATPPNPQGWHVHAAILRNPHDGSGGHLTPPATTSLVRLMGQTGVANRGWTGKVAAYLVIDGNIPSNREDYLIRRWLRSL